MGILPWKKRPYEIKQEPKSGFAKVPQTSNQPSTESSLTVWLCCHFIAGGCPRSPLHPAIYFVEAVNPFISCVILILLKSLLKIFCSATPLGPHCAPLRPCDLDECCVNWSKCFMLARNSQIGLNSYSRGRLFNCSHQSNITGIWNLSTQWIRDKTTIQ